MTEISVQQRFEELIKDRVRDDIGKLMPDEALAAIVEKAIEGAFFTKRITGNSWNERTESSWIEEHVKTLVAERMNKAVSDFMAAHSGRLENIIEAGLREHAPAMLAKALVGQADARMYNFQHQFQQMLARGA